MKHILIIAAPVFASREEAEIRARDLLAALPAGPAPGADFRFSVNREIGGSIILDGKCVLAGVADPAYFVFFAEARAIIRTLVDDKGPGA